MKRKKKAKRAKREGQNRPSQSSRRKKGPVTARDRLRLESVLVDDRDDGVKGETVRAVDTIILLSRRGQIDERQYRAAETYRNAAELCGGSIPCTLQQRGGGGGGVRRDHSPTEAQMRAAGLLSDASRILGQLDARIVTLIAVEGYSVEQCTAWIFGIAPGGKAKRGDAEHVGRRLRLALDALAEAWWPTHGRHSVRMSA